MHEDLALMQFYFGKAGDRWRHAEPLLRQMPVAQVVLELCNTPLVWEGGRHRIPTQCPKCGVTRLTRSGHYVLIFTGGGVFDISGDRNQPHRVTCSACDGAIDALALLDDLNFSAKERDALLDGPFRKYAPRMSMWVVAESEAGKHSIGRTVSEALDELLGATYENEQRLCRVEHYSREQATRLAREHSKDMPWRTVEIDSRTLEAKNPRWHGGDLLPWELHKIADDKVVARIVETKALDVELEQIRRRRLAELGWS
jgi:hypothetical protein